MIVEGISRFTLAVFAQRFHTTAALECLLWGLGDAADAAGGAPALRDPASPLSLAALRALRRVRGQRRDAHGAAPVAALLPRGAG